MAVEGGNPLVAQHHDTTFHDVPMFLIVPAEMASVSNYGVLVEAPDSLAPCPVTCICE